MAIFALVAGTMVAMTLGAPVEAQAQAQAQARTQARALCPGNAICLWRGERHTGTRYVWTGGYHDLPGNFTDHVGSFRANTGGAFIDWASGKECHSVRKGDYRDYYLSGFGGKMDAVGRNC
ncbi:peptidase inhibitor family I36 protein [Streptomyces sp. TG1A-8]|uniref:peptidase inhibitor family I36 protein n=1 Tax=Streptomyces sp. TG1A-8 TaxID=3051385 RepID=UPI00265B8CED|nr:peptidase inhibitor family I36 protein [Streptomyces sp. TG1A-8]MDO0924238.1 peptidase inhibitor family I36 protein [Streptomyces sp. TG1A-8]